MLGRSRSRHGSALCTFVSQSASCLWEARIVSPYSKIGCNLLNSQERATILLDESTATSFSRSFRFFCFHTSNSCYSGLPC